MLSQERQFLYAYVSPGCDDTISESVATDAYDDDSFKDAISEEDKEKA
jgi:hypothetical protein